MSVFKRRRFPAEVILLCVRWYCRYGISYRDLEEMMAERGVAVDHVTLYRWIQRRLIRAAERAGFWPTASTQQSLVLRHETKDSRHVS